MTDPQKLLALAQWARSPEPGDLSGQTVIERLSAQAGTLESQAIVRILETLTAQVPKPQPQESQT